MPERRGKLTPDEGGVIQFHEAGRIGLNFRSAVQRVRLLIATAMTIEERPEIAAA
jgi:hypothetical protein